MAEDRSVLVVEDNEQNLELVAFLLQEAGITVLSAPDATVAREVLARSLPDLILMDMQLPGTDGLSLVAEIRADSRTRAIPVVALTAHAMRGDRERFLAGGCNGYIAKPIDATSFVATVRRFFA